MEEKRHGGAGRVIVVILILAVLLAAGVLGAYLLLGRQTGSYVMISKDNEEIGTYSLKDDRVIDVGDGNPLDGAAGGAAAAVENGEIYMESAACPDQICVHTGWIDQEHDMIVCMPNKVVVQIVEQ